MISKHQDDTDVDIPYNINEDVSNNINVCITTNEDNSTLESYNKVHVNITPIENKTVFQKIGAATMSPEEKAILEEDFNI